MNNQSPAQNHLMSARIVWIALNFTILIYIFILFFTEKISALWFPHESLTVLQKISLCSSLLFIVSFFIHATKVNQTTFPEKLKLMFITWMINESVVVIAFATTFISESENGFFILLNAGLAVVANMLMYPRQISNVSRSR